MPDDRTTDREPGEFPDVLAEFGQRRAPNVYGESASPTDYSEEEWEEPDEDDLELLGLSSQAATIEYHCTRQELEEAGYGGAYTEDDLAEMPEIDSEFMAPRVVTDPLDYLEALYDRRLRELLDLIEWCDWTALPGFTRLTTAILDRTYPACPLEVA
jgi:hypothetical protein